MQSYLLAAGVLMILIGVAHSVIGEILIFRQLRAGAIVPLLAPAQVLEDLGDLGLVQRLVLEQGQREPVQHVPVLGQDRVGLVVGGVDQPADLFVDHEGHVVRVVALVGHVPAQERLAAAKSEVIVMHPGPINRGVEMDSQVADGRRSVILEQVTNGIAVRMAVMSIVLGNRYASAEERS